MQYNISVVTFKNRKEKNYNKIHNWRKFSLYSSLEIITKKRQIQAILPGNFYNRVENNYKRIHKWQNMNISYIYQTDWKFVYKQQRIQRFAKNITRS